MPDTSNSKNGLKPSKPLISGKTVKRDAHGRIQVGSAPLNPRGRPSEGESWQAIFKRIFEMTLDEAAGYAGELGRRIRKFGKGSLTGKELVAFAVLQALAFDPQASLLNAVMDRAEGKVTQPIELSYQAQIIELLRAGQVTPTQVRAELGEDAVALFAAAGVAVEVGSDAGESTDA